MSRPCYETCAVLRNDRIARDTFRIRLESTRIASEIRPGQFVMLRWDYSDDPLLGRPFALYDTYLGVDGTVLALDLVYLVAGKLTSRLAELRMGDRLAVWGPLGNGFSMIPCSHLIMVAGGIGQTPFLAVANAALGRKRYGSANGWTPCPQVTLCYGARSREYLAGLDDFRETGLDLHLATDDGSRGHHGFVTDVLVEILDQATASTETNLPRVLCCGPEKMMARTARICAERRIQCQISLETPMACGIGACFTCVTRVLKTGRDWDYQRTCIEGPVFDANRIVWD